MVTGSILWSRALSGSIPHGPHRCRDDKSLINVRACTVRDAAIEIRVWRSPALISDFEGEIEPLPALNFFDFRAESANFSRACGAGSVGLGSRMGSRGNIIPIF